MFSPPVWAGINNRAAHPRPLPIRKRLQERDPKEKRGHRQPRGALLRPASVKRSRALRRRRPGGIDRIAGTNQSPRRFSCILPVQAWLAGACLMIGEETVERDRQAYIDKLKAQLDQWNAEIRKFEAKAREAQADQRIRRDEAVDDMHQRRDEAQKMLKRVQEASAASWEDLRTGFDAAWSDVSKAMDRAMAHWR